MCTVHHWERVSEVSEVWAWNSYGPCMMNGVLRLVTPSVVCGAKVQGGGGPHEVEGMHPDSKSLVPISTVSKLSSPSSVLCFVLSATHEKMPGKHASSCSCISAPTSCTDAGTSNNVPVSLGAGSTSCALAIWPLLTAPGQPVVLPSCDLSVPPIYPRTL